MSGVREKKKLKKRKQTTDLTEPLGQSLFYSNMGWMFLFRRNYMNGGGINKTELTSSLFFFLFIHGSRIRPTNYPSILNTLARVFAVHGELL